MYIHLEFTPGSRPSRNPSLKFDLLPAKILKFTSKCQIQPVIKLKYLFSPPTPLLFYFNFENIVPILRSNICNKSLKLTQTQLRTRATISKLTNFFSFFTLSHIIHIRSFIELRCIRHYPTGRNYTLELLNQKILMQENSKIDKVNMTN